MPSASGIPLFRQALRPTIILGMKFLFASAYSGLGGGESIQLNLAEELTRRGLEAQLLVREEGEFAQRWRELGQTVHLLPFRPSSVYFLPARSASSAVVQQMAAILRSEKIQLGHADYHSLPYFSPAAGSLGIPRLWICMGNWFHPKSWQHGFFCNIEGRFALTQEIREQFQKKRGFFSQRIELKPLHPGVDTKKFQPAPSRSAREALEKKFNFEPDSQIILHVGRFQDVKGHDTFQEIARLVSQENPKARFLVVGENLQRAADANYQQRILSCAQADPILKERMVYAGFVDEITDVYAAADVFVCPSRCESYGMANLEAMACAVPVVSTNCGGPSETIIDGVCGFLVPPRDAKTYAERILRLLADHDLRLRMGAAGRRHVEENFNLRDSTDRFLEHCVRLLRASPPQ